MDPRGPRVGSGRRRRTLREQYPVFFAFDPDPVRFLGHAESIAATPQDRIKSVWPFLAKVVMRFADTLRPRERANYDPEDVLLELYVTLMERDCKWQPARGRYLTFVARVVANEFHKIRDRTRTVKSPNNSYCRLKEYEAEEKAETISDQRSATLGAMRRVLSDSETLDGDESIARDENGPGRDAERREELAIFADAVVQGVMGLTLEEASAIGAAYGLWGQPERAIREIAEGRGHTHGTVKAAQARARSKIRIRLEAMGHPVADPDTIHDEVS